MRSQLQPAWESFEPHDYLTSNYLVMNPNDASIIAKVRDHFSDHFQGRRGRQRCEGIDIGSGPNLYPALVMLPWCDHVSLFDVSPANVHYLTEQLPSYDALWDQFWDLLSSHQAYQPEAGPRSSFRAAVTVDAASIFDLRSCSGRWSMGTMFFLAESITMTPEGFRDAVACFMNALQPGAPFAAAFMEHSSGFRIGADHFPAHDVDEGQVRDALVDHAEDLSIHRWERADGLIHSGHTGMLLACGRREAGHRPS
ncbi:SCO2525 family SAM-dependent methyltransferase [Streptomyces sp. NPDC056948]|uniref:SCO2525 family SAM-dependent methyltransferase n=1 Tax=Streptomyces sp. NPDC056948 TaxID=3345975 RepID=UPI00363CAAFB